LEENGIENGNEDLMQFIARGGTLKLIWNNNVVESIKPLVSWGRNIRLAVPLTSEVSKGR